MAQPQVAHRLPSDVEDNLSAEGREGNPTDWSVGWSSLLWGGALVLLANVFLWFWDYKFAFYAGLNSASREFTLYYRTLFWGELITLGAFTGIWY
jgi:hypothetical protein